MIPPPVSCGAQHWWPSSLQIVLRFSRISKMKLFSFSDFLFQMKTAVGRLSVSNYCTRSLWRYSSKLLLLSKIVLQDFLQTECLSNWRPINTHRQAMCTYERIRICQAGGCGLRGTHSENNLICKVKTPYFRVPNRHAMGLPGI